MLPLAPRSGTASPTWAALDQLLKSLPPPDWRTGEFLDATDSDTSRIRAILVLSIDSLARRRDAALTIDDLQDAVRRLRRAGYFRILRALLLRQYATSIALAIPGTKRQPENDALYDGLCPPRKIFNSRSGMPRPKEPHRPDETRITELVREELRRRKLGEGQKTAIWYEVHELYKAVANLEGRARSTARQATELSAIPGANYWKAITLPAHYVRPRDTASRALATLAERGAVLLVGPPGSGKTQLAICLLQEVCRLHNTDGWYILATKSGDALQTLHSLRKLPERPMAVVLDLSDRADAGVREVMDALRCDERLRGRLIIAIQDDFMGRSGMPAAEWQEALCRVQGLSNVEMSELLETLIESLQDRLPAALSDLQDVVSTGAQRLQFPLDAEWFVREELAAVVRSQESLDEAIARSKRAAARAADKIAAMPLPLQRALIAACIDDFLALPDWPAVYGDLAPTLAAQAGDLLPCWWSELHWLFQKTGDQISLLDTYRSALCRAVRGAAAQALAHEVLDLAFRRLQRGVESPAIDIVASATWCDPAAGRMIAARLLRATRQAVAHARSVWFAPGAKSVPLQVLPNVRDAIALAVFLGGSKPEESHDWLLDLVHDLLRDHHHVLANALWEAATLRPKQWDNCVLATSEAVIKGFPDSWNVGLADTDRHYGALEVLELGDQIALAPVVRDRAGKPVFVGAPRAVTVSLESGVHLTMNLNLGLRLVCQPEERKVSTAIMYRDGQFAGPVKLRQLHFCGELAVVLTTDNRIVWQTQLEWPAGSTKEARCYRFLNTEFLSNTCHEITQRRLGEPVQGMSWVAPVDDPDVRRVDRYIRRMKQRTK
ncbi:MAG: ATP-binding protein [Deltaproteobacteria bacterium]|nr:ATP-binding protein [Deltaproteobacteria bacterium]